MKSWKEIVYVNSNQKGAGTDILPSDKFDPKSKIFTRDTESYYMGSEKSMWKEDTTESQNIWSKYSRSNREIDHSTIIVGDFNTLL